MPSLSLEEPLWVPKIASGRDFPAFWLRRIVFCDDPAAFSPSMPLRFDRRFHRGLNIIWADESRGGGHGAGKTTLCQMMRYCLGEPSYGPKRLTTKVAQILPNGVVGAEVVVGGIEWAVARPATLHDKKAYPSRCKKDSTLDELLASLSDADDYAGFHTALREQLLSRVTCFDENTHDAPDFAEKILAWLSRDQDAHYDDLHTWRRTSTGSGVQNPRTKEDSHRLIRQVLGLYGTDEAEARRKAAQAEAKLKKARTIHQSAMDELDRAKLILATAFEVPPERIQEETDLIDLGGVRYLRAKLDEESHAADALQDDPELHEIREEENRRRNDVGRYEQSVTTHFENLEKSRSLLEREEKILGDLVDHHYDLLEDPSCELCRHSLSEVLAKFGETDPGPAVDIEIRKVEAATRAAEVAKAKHEGDIKEHTIRLDTAKLDLQKAIGLCAAAEKQRIERDAELLRKQGEHSTHGARFQMAIGAFEGLETKRENIRRAKAALDSKDRELQTITSRIMNGFVSHEESRRAIERNYHRLTTRILGNSYVGSLRITSEGLVEPKWRRKTEEVSTALNALRVIVFDLAALLSGLEGEGGFPGFLIHDSPRESDLMLGTYHNVFREVKRWTTASDEGSAPFQYIITTTTPPPDELRGPEWVNQPVLDSSTAAGRLLALDIGEETTEDES